MFQGVKEITKIYEDLYGDIWFFTSNNIGVLRLQEDGTYTKITKPFYRIQKKFISGSFENIYTYNKKNAFIGGQEGLLHYTLNNNKKFDFNYYTFFDEVKIKTRKIDTADMTDRLAEKKINIIKKQIELPYKFNSICNFIK